VLLAWYNYTESSMHISLDSALGRQRRLNSVGESVFQIAPDASAGYSLRSLTGGDPSVVRVRRDSDNGERDFRSSEINSGEMVSWVNQQVIAPLDIRELEADGRTGDFLIAKAAYSLRSLGARQATLAATGDTVARADGKFVIQARRTSDDALKSFTADEVTDGTLTAWVTEYVANLVGNARYFNGTSTSVEVNRPATNSFAISGSFLSVNTGGYGILSFGDDINNRFYLGAASSGRIQIFNVNAGSLVFDQTVLTDYADGTIHNFSFVTGVSGTILTIDGSEIINISTQIRTNNFVTSKMRFGSRFTTAYASYIQGTLYDITIDSTNAYTGLGTSVTAWEDTIGSNNGTEVNGATYTGQGFDGMVSKWYDQSVTNQAGGTASGNHATQATASLQPKIVNAGSLLTDGIDFDGTSQAGLVTGSFSLTQAFTTFSVSHTDDASTSLGIWATAASATSNFNTASFFRNDDGLAVNAGTTLTTAGTIDYVADRTYLQTNVVNGGSSSIFVDGATGATGNAGSTNPSGVLIIGYFKSGSYLNLDGAIKEFIIYDTDQTDNRLAIEANIGETYSIAGIPAYANTVNGFVETWYDQSGNGKDATQLTAANQPKIVDAGNLVANGLGFFTNDLLETASLGASQPITAFSVFTQDSASSTIYGSSGSHALITSSSNTISLNAGTALVSSASITVGTPALVSSLANSTSSFIFINGGNTTTGNAGTTGITGSLKLGSTNSNRAMEGELQEFIIYNSDQTANRIAIETNINSHYDIF
jgi:hypothetical protein